MARAVAPVVTVVEGVKPGQLELPTPCSDYDVRGLINHFAGTTAWLERVGRRLSPDADDPFGANSDVTTGDWQALLTARIRAVAAAWDEPSAWEGSIEGVQMPATMIGQMAFAELLIHGWDLARATGQRVDYTARTPSGRFTGSSQRLRRWAGRWAPTARRCRYRGRPRRSTGRSVWPGATRTGQHEARRPRPEYLLTLTIVEVRSSCHDPWSVRQ